MRTKQQVPGFPDVQKTRYEFVRYIFNISIYLPNGWFGFNVGELTDMLKIHLFSNNVTFFDVILGTVKWQIDCDPLDTVPLENALKTFEEYVKSQQLTIQS